VLFDAALCSAAELCMTQLIETTATPLAEYLAGPDFAQHPTLQPYLGALTPQRLDASEAETEALLFGAALHDLGWLRRVAVRGEDSFRWLSGMVTNEVETLPAQGGAYNFLLNAQGRIQGDAYVWRDGDALEIEVTAAQFETLLAHLDRFIIMDDVELAPIHGQSALGLTGPRAETVLKQAGLSAPGDLLSHAGGSIAGIPVRIYRGYGTIVPHYALWAEAGQIPALWKALREAGGAPVGSSSLETLRMIEGIPAYGVDIESRDLPQETSQLRAIHFSKGCYLGQEIVERIRSRGQVHRHLRALELFPEGNAGIPASGTELRRKGETTDAKPAGALTSIAALQLAGARRIFAIAMIRAEAETGSQPLVFPSGTARILNTPPQFAAS
jgi:folate-binding protein YgfZ